MNKEEELLATTYKKLTHKEHIKQLTDTYIGSVQERKENMFILVDGETPHIEYKEIDYNPGLYKIIDEILVNSYDQYTRLRINSTNIPISELVKVTKIKVSVDVKKTRTLISVYNNGNGIPVVKHPKHDLWIPELLFGELLTSTNYDFEADKVTAGKNGYGSKLTNIFSKKFTVETVDHIRKKKYRQVFLDHMEKKEPAEISDTSEEPYTKFTFEPDLKMFKVKEMNMDMVGFIARRVYDIAGCTDRDVSVYYNGKKVSVRDFNSYIQLYTNFGGKNYVYQKLSDRWEIGVAFMPDNVFQQISFVNGTFTRNGGTHVNYILSSLIREIVLSMHKKYREELGGRTIKAQYIKDNIWLFVKATISNPSFDSQTKESLTNTPTNFGSTVDIDENFAKKIIAAGLGDKIVQIVNQKEGALVAKQDKANLKTLKIPKLDDAVRAGTSDWDKCTLILTEGDSAKALAISGLSVIGREFYGVFPLKGKILNVREHKLLKINENEEISNLKKIIGLEYGKKYDDLTRTPLRYRYVMIMADQDYDGSHIKGLFFNFIHSLWPELVTKHNFIRSLLTPIVKASKGDKVISFYNNKEYLKWAKNNEGSSSALIGWNIKYYKGLGTNTAKEAKEYFKAIKTSTINYVWDSKSESALILAFEGSYADKRKEWLSHINEPEHEPLDQATHVDVTYNEFVQRELIYFSNYDNIRSIPSLVDGLKPAQRKILYAGFKKNLSSGVEIKVAQFVGYVSEHTAYHHGENSLAGAIINMAQDFTGSNNINLLQPSGQFGTRLGGGRDAASPRYIFTEFAYYLSGKNKKYITPLIFPSDDRPLLQYLDDDGMLIEPKYYVPILPMVLVNGASGIGTGFSTDIPSYNPLEIIDNIYQLMSGKEQTPLKPWYRNFTGTITANADAPTYTAMGIWKQTDDQTIEISELPIGVWTDTYKEFLENMRVNKKDDGLIIKKISNFSTEETVRIIIKCEKASLDKIIKEGTINKALKLHTIISTKNMYLFDQDGNIKKYTSPEEIVAEFYPLRLKYYGLRKKNMLDLIKEELQILGDKKKYIEYVIDHKDLLFKKKDEIIKKIEELKISDVGMLLRLPSLSFSKEMVTALKESYEQKTLEYETLEKRSPISLWKADLEAFQEAYTPFIKN